MSENIYNLYKYVLYMNNIKPNSTQKVKEYFVDWVEFYLLGGILPKDHLVTWLSDDKEPIIGRLH